MARTVGIGLQDFGKVITGQCFYIDKTLFIKEWWENMDDVTLITRPRRFGKTLNMSMVEQFFSVKYAGHGDWFEGLSIWKEEKYRQLQGTYPVISLSFANVKERDYRSARDRICQLLAELYARHDYLRKWSKMAEADRRFFDSVSPDMPEVVATIAIYKLCNFLCRYYGKKVIVLLDEYDTPMQEAYVHGYWEELVSFTRSIFNSSFKTNPCMERAILTGIILTSAKNFQFLPGTCRIIRRHAPGRKENLNAREYTRVSKESFFSDLNNLEVVTTTSDKYATAFGFTEGEVFDALEECGLSSEKEQVKRWYNGFAFGEHQDIYNPWSIINFLDKGKLAPYWANTSSNSLVGRLLQQGSRRVKEQFERLLLGESIKVPIDEQIVYNQLDQSESAVWSLLLAGGTGHSQGADPQLRFCLSGEECVDRLRGIRST